MCSVTWRSLRRSTASRPSRKMRSPACGKCPLQLAGYAISHLPMATILPALAWSGRYSRRRPLISQDVTLSEIDAEARGFVV